MTTTKKPLVLIQVQDGKVTVRDNFHNLMALFTAIMEDRVVAFMICKVFLAILTHTGLVTCNSTPGMLLVVAEEAGAWEGTPALATGVDDAAGSQSSGWAKQPCLFPLLNGHLWNIIWRQFS